MRIIVCYDSVGSTPVMSTYRHEDSHTEEKIAAILNEAQNAMQKKDVCEKVK